MPRLLTVTVALVALLFAGSVACAAEDYPSRPITLIVPYPPGGGVDPMGRLSGQRLTDALGPQVIIDNRGGAGGQSRPRPTATRWS